MTDPGIRTSFASIVTFVIGSLIEFFPESLSLPRTEFRLEFWIKLWKGVGPHFEKIAQVSKMSEDGFEGGGVAKKVENLIGHGYFR